MSEQISFVEIGKRIKNARKRAGFSQQILHEKTGISITQISSYENGKRNIGLLSLIKIANALDVTMDELCSTPYERKPVLEAQNDGELIVNCISALFDKGVIGVKEYASNNSFEYDSPYGPKQICFNSFLDLLDSLATNLKDLRLNYDNYPNPESFKSQILAAYANQINKRLNAAKEFSKKFPVF